MNGSLAERLYEWLPGLYRDKDETGELLSFLKIGAQPLDELQASIAQLLQDFSILACRAEFISLVGGVVGVTADPALPARARRAEVQEAVLFYRSKGLREPLERYAGQLSGWPVTLVDFSEAVAQVPFLESLNPVELRRDQPCGEQPAGSGNFFFSAERVIQPLFDALTGRPITRSALSGNEARYAGVEGRFTIKERGVDLFAGRAAAYTAVAADLTSFGSPRTPTGDPLVILAGQVAVDPVLGRFRIVSPRPAAGNLTVSYAALVPASIRTQAFDVSDPFRMESLGGPADPAPYSADLRAPRLTTDRFGQKHFDNLGVFLTPGRQIANARPNVLPPGSESGRFTFDGRPLAPDDAQGTPLQLMDGVDGSPITRRKLAGHESEFCGTPRGFGIRVKGLPVTEVVAADLSDFDNPQKPTGGVLTLGPLDVAVDPQLGRFRMGVTSEDVRVDYLLGMITSVEGGTPKPLAAGVPVFSFDASGADAALRDAYDGTPLSVLIRLGNPLSAYHGTPRGWRILRNGVDVAGALAPVIRDLGDRGGATPAGRLAIDLDRGRFRFPAGFLRAGDRLLASYSFEDPNARDAVFENVARRLPRALPAGVVPIVVDSRRSRVNPAYTG